MLCGEVDGAEQRGQLQQRECCRGNWDQVLAFEDVFVNAKAAGAPKINCDVLADDPRDFSDPIIKR